MTTDCLQHLDSAGFLVMFGEDGEEGPPLHSPQELVPVESIEKVVSQGLLAHEVV